MSILKIKSKLPHVGTTIFTEMSQLAAQANAINLSQGFPDYPVNQELLDLLQKFNQEGHHQYAPMIGIPALRAAIQSMVYNTQGIHYDLDQEITITAGASEAIFDAIAAFVQYQDEVIIFEPAYDLYTPVVELFGGVVKPIQLFAPNFNIDWDQVAANISSKTKCIIINHPNNPTGKVLNDDDLSALALLAEKHNLLVISDEVYSRIVFQNASKFKSIGNIDSLRDRSIVIASFGKLLHTTGWKIGYALAAPAITTELRKVHQFNTFSVSHAPQHAIAAYLANENAYNNLDIFFESKYQYLSKALLDIGFDVLPSEGTYFLNAGYNKLSQATDATYAKELITSYGVATIPVSAFYSGNYQANLLRFCFAKQESTLQAAIERLQVLK